MQQMHHTNLHPSSSVTPGAHTPSPHAPPPPGPFGAYGQMGDPSMMGHMATPEMLAASQGLPGLGFPNPLHNPLHPGYPHSLGSRLAHHPGQQHHPGLPPRYPSAGDSLKIKTFINYI